MKLSLAVDGFLLAKEVAGCSPNTIRNYRHALGRFAVHFEPADPLLADIAAGDVRDFLHQLMTTQVQPGGIAPRPARKLSAKTIQNVYTCLCSLWTWAIKEGYADRHVVRQVDAPKPEPPAIEPLTQEQVKELLEAARFSKPWHSSPETQTELPRFQRLRDRALILFLLDTGVRASELCRLTIGEVDLHSGSARVRGKGRLNSGQGKSRMVRLGKRTRKAVWQYLADRDAIGAADEPLFATRSEGFYDRRALRTHLHRLGKRAGIDKVYPHRFRHTFATNYLRNGGDIYTLQSLLGHTSLEMVKRYLAIAQADAERAHRRASPVDNWKL